MTNGSGARRPKNTRIRIQIPNTAVIGDWIPAYMRLAHNRELAGLLTALGKLLTRARQLMAAPPNPLQMTREDTI